MEKLTYNEFLQLTEEEREQKFNELVKERNTYQSWWQEDFSKNDKLVKRVEELESEIEERKNFVAEISSDHSEEVRSYKNTISRLVEASDIEEINDIKTELLVELLKK